MEPNPGDSEGSNSRRNSQPNENNFTNRNIILHITVTELDSSPGGGGGSNPLCKPHRYVQPQRVGVWGFFGRPRTAINFAQFGLASGMVFEEQSSYRFNSKLNKNEIEKCEF